ncbi:hypothetical protein [Sinorhizobium americanum]|nr:hypothetical protein [Sinorhizobium americanum]APG90144.1 hypothetical protein SAMCFNEI73_Ch0821 [Sinorhizobium americanum]OAP48544.1 hypothetical protein ATC00_06215 [Sinorhizobium americanum]
MMSADCYRAEVARLGDRGKGSAERSGQKQENEGEPTQHAGKIGYSTSNKKGQHEEIAGQ